MRCDVRGAKDEYARARAVAVASEAQMTAIFARGVSHREANGDGRRTLREAKDGVVRRETAKRAHGV